MLNLGLQVTGPRVQFVRPVERHIINRPTLFILDVLIVHSAAPKSSRKFTCLVEPMSTIWTIGYADLIDQLNGYWGSLWIHRRLEPTLQSIADINLVLARRQQSAKTGNRTKTIDLERLQFSQFREAAFGRLQHPGNHGLP
jgi:hypothetical protein